MLKDDLKNAVPESLKSTVRISVLSVPGDGAWLVPALTEALIAIERFVRCPTAVEVIIGSSPFHLETPTCDVDVQTKGNAINYCFGGMILLDWAKMQEHPYPIRVVCILEEFVHRWMTVHDAGLTSQIVTALYPQVYLLEGKYAVRSESHKSQHG